MHGISVIVPVFNAERYLPHCLDTLIAQTYPSDEIILVDDGSTDGSLDICNKYSKINERVIVFHTENRGPGNARNIGLEHSSGRWICFVDADDWCDDSFLSVFVDNNDKDYDLIIQGHVFEHLDGREDYFLPQEKEYNEQEVANCIRENGLLNRGGPTCKLFKKSIISDNNIQFPIQYRYGEDTVFFFRYLLFCKRIKSVSSTHYHYVEHSNDTLSKKIHASEDLMHFIRDSVSLVQGLAPDSNELIIDYNKKAVFYSRRAYSNMFKLGYNKARIISSIFYYQHHVRRLLTTEGLNLKGILLLVLSDWSPLIQYYLLRFFCAVGIIRR